MSSNPAEVMRSSGVKVTAQRIAVFQAVGETPHITADDVTVIVRQRLGTISRQAVYDALGLLVDKGLVRRIEPAYSAARYETRVGDNHHHLICRSCGKVVDVDCSVGNRPCLTAEVDHGYVIDEAEVVYWGHCSACQTTPTFNTTQPGTSRPT